MIFKEKTLHVLVLSAGKILKDPFGGEDLFSRHLSMWVARLHHKVTLMGIEYAGARVKTITYVNAISELSPKIRKSRNQTRRFKFSYLFYSLRTVYWIFQFLRILSIDLMNPISVIHAQDSGYTGLAAIIAGKILQIPVVITLHGIRYQQIESNPYVNKILKCIELKIEHRLDAYTLSNASVVTLVSPTFKSYVERVAPECTVVNIPVAINGKDFEFSEINKRKIREEFGIQNRFKIIGYLGRLAYEKNLRTLLFSFAAALQHDPYLILVLVGEGPLEIELKKIISELNMEDSVIFCGFRNDVNSILSSFDVFILPSIIEGTSNALLQAMFCGRAIICSDIPGNRGLVTDNKDALLVDPNDSNKFRDAIILLSSDNELNRKLGHNAKNTASQYDEEIVFPRIMRLYESCLKNK